MMLEEAGFKGNYYCKCIENFVPQMSVKRAFNLNGFDRNSMAELIEDKECSK